MVSNVFKFKHGARPKFLAAQRLAAVVAGVRIVPDSNETGTPLIRTQILGAVSVVFGEGIIPDDAFANCRTRECAGAEMPNQIIF